MKRQSLFFAPMMLFFAIGIGSCSKSNNGTATPKENILYQTHFATDDGKWAVGNINKGGATYYQSGNYVVVGGVDASTFTYSYIADVFTGISGKSAVTASINVLKPTNPGLGGNGGLIWGCQPNAQDLNYNVFAISYIGQWGLFHFERTSSVSNSWTITAIAPWTSNNVIQTGQFNDLTVLQNNGQLQFSINGSQVYEMNATGGTLDQTGLFADVYSTLQANNFEAEDWQ
ncbi:MAG TPA: hypothetical protein VGS79_08535 [Puia sp.]|nr:hypothetical protein [Puia sp.]